MSWRHCKSHVVQWWVRSCTASPTHGTPYRSMALCVRSDVQGSSGPSPGAWGQTGPPWDPRTQSQHKGLGCEAKQRQHRALQPNPSMQDKVEVVQAPEAKAWHGGSDLAKQWAPCPSSGPWGQKVECHWSSPIFNNIINVFASQTITFA